MPRQTEPSINNALGNILQGMMRTCAVRSEISGAFQGYSGRQPDILITAPYRSPVVIEAEVRPSGNAENEAVSRLGLELAGGTGNVEAAIALYYPENMRGYDDLHAALRDATLEYCVFTKEETEITRFPKSGWLNGGVSDLAELARLVSVPQSLVDDAANRLQYGIDRANAVLDEAAELGTANTEDIANLLGMTDVSQTRRMACAVIANAMVFHHHIARQHTEIRALNRLWRSAVDNPQARVADAWDEILKINYWPIFAVARDIVNLLPLHAAARILDELRETAQGINSTGAAFAHDLTGRVFQRLIADRKYLATFYTLPASASLLARIAVAKLDGIDWSDPDAIAQLRVGDFACGTGALLSAVYEQIALRHEKAGGDPADLH
ncbi:MAG: hypothetical protein F4X57_10185, partial [Chloroflexi bacterium]|nr:hypothetical protein [Chloroflexota bacterium]